MCLIWRSSESCIDSWPKAWEGIRQREMASKTKRHGARRKSFDAEYVSMRLPPVLFAGIIRPASVGTRDHMDIALHKHSANMNILPNPDAGLWKRICLPRHGGGRRVCGSCSR